MVWKIVAQIEKTKKEQKNWYPQDLIGRARLFDIPAAN